MKSMDLNKVPRQEKQNEFLDKEGVYKIIQNAPKFSFTEEVPAPFRDFDKNTNEVWNYVLPQEVEEYLNKKLFFDTSVIPHESKRKIAEIYTSANEKIIEIPLDLVVCAAGFDDWRGRPKGDTKSWEIKYGTQKLSGNMPSLDVSKLYAGTPSDLPYVRAMRMYVQPNKKVFFENVGGDSHRIAAAILRGNKDIQTKSLTVYQLDNDYL